MLEVVRMDKFPKALSRFQSFFAVQKEYIDKCCSLIQIHVPYQIVEVSANYYEKYDMSLLKGDGYGPSHYYAEKYWSGEQSSSPVFEYLLKPPVNIMSIVRIAAV